METERHAGVDDAAAKFRRAFDEVAATEPFWLAAVWRAGPDGKIRCTRTAYHFHSNDVPAAVETLLRTYEIVTPLGATLLPNAPLPRAEPKDQADRVVEAYREATEALYGKTEEEAPEDADADSGDLEKSGEGGVPCDS